MESSPPAGLQPNHEERQWAMLCHISALLMYATAIGGFVAPLIIWLMKRDTMPFVDDQGRETVNFQITIMLALMVAFPFCLIVIGIPIVVGLLLLHFVTTIIGAIKSSEGVLYRYPFCWRVIRARGP